MTTAPDDTLTRRPVYLPKSDLGITDALIRYPDEVAMLLYTLDKAGKTKSRSHRARYLNDLMEFLSMSRATGRGKQ